MDLDIEGTWNLRDLGGPRTGIAPGRLLRSDSLHRVHASGWRQLVEHGVRTVVDLRNSAEVARAPTQAPAEVEVVPVPLEEGLHETPIFQDWFRSGVIGTPLYYLAFLERWPDRAQLAFEAVTTAAPGVLVHCSKGCDRTGMIVALVLRALGLDHDTIVQDYLQTAIQLKAPRARGLGVKDDSEAIAGVLDRAGITLERALVDFLDRAPPMRLPETGWPVR